MDRDIQEKLLDLNRSFYEVHAGSFSATRQKLQPGVKCLADRLLQADSFQNILDLGCGNGRLAAYLEQHNFNGNYLGLDVSQELINVARSTSHYRFFRIDLADPGWGTIIPQAPFDQVMAFAVLHHFPGEEVQLKFLSEVHRLLSPGGCFVHSEWQILRNPRLAKHILPWETIGLSGAQVEAGDVLVDWRADGEQGLRYVHGFTIDELAELAAKSGFEIEETFFADGREGNLGLYQVWKDI